MKTMRRLGSIAVSLLAFGSMSAHAIVIGFDPDFQTATATDLVSVDLIAELAVGEAAVGSYDVDVLFDPTALTLNSVTSTGGLGSSLFNGFEVFPDTIDIAEVSFESLADLEVLQGSSIVLATLQFAVDVLAEGTSTFITINGTDPLLFITDNPGNLNPFDTIVLGGAEIRNSGGTQPIPESPPLALILLGLGLLSIRRTDW